MTLRRYAPITPSKGTVWPTEVRMAAYIRDGGCVGPRVGMPGECSGSLELDHVRASGGIGMKSRSTLDNAAFLCGVHHRAKTNAGRTWRPALLDYIARSEDPHAHHVDPCSPECHEGRTDPDGTYHPTAEDYAMGNMAAGHEHWDDR